MPSVVAIALFMVQIDSTIANTCFSARAGEPGRHAAEPEVPSAPALMAVCVLQGIWAAMTMPVGRMAIVRVAPKGELLPAYFDIFPALLGPFLSPTVGGLVVYWLSWRDNFFTKVPIDLAALGFGWRDMPDYRAEATRPRDCHGLRLFGSVIPLLSWVHEVFDGYRLTAGQALVPLAASGCC